MSNDLFSVKEHLKASWNLVDGSKWPVWAPILVLMLITFGITIVLTLLFSLVGLPGFHGGFTIGYGLGYIIIAFIVEVIVLFITAPLIAGAQMVALKRVRGEAIDHGMGFSYWSLWVNLGLTLVIFTLGFGLLNVVFGFLFLLASYASYWLVFIFQLAALVAIIVFYALFFFSVLFVADKGKEPIDALKASYELVKPQVILVSRLYACVFVAFLIVMLPYFLLSLTGLTVLSLLGLLITIGLGVWALPYFHLIISGAFHKLVD